MTAPAATFHIGVDENGLGPQLGPMIVTAAMARVANGAERVLTTKPRGALASRLGDSKSLVSHGNCVLGEAWSRALVSRNGQPAEAPSDLVKAISLEDHAWLTSPCPNHVEPQCWSTRDEAFEDGDDMLRDVSKDLKRLAKRGVDLVSVRSVIMCTRRLNAAVDRGHSRFVVDLHAMERLILSFREQAGEPVNAVCGKVGGFGQYGRVFGPLAGRLHATLEEGRARSAYRFPGVGDIAFERDCDDKNILVGLASLVGKYLRELLMARIIRHYRRHDDRLPRASGYHDPISGEFILGTAALRRKQRVPNDCFKRTKIGS